MLLIGTNKEVVVKNTKGPSHKKSILILKTNKEEGLLPDMIKNFLFIELSKKTLNEMYIFVMIYIFPTFHSKCSTILFFWDYFKETYGKIP